MSGRARGRGRAALALCLLLPAAADPPPETALREGNRLFRDGDLPGARDAWAEGWRDAGGPQGSAAALLAYNLGTTAQLRGELPEAVLWYRRAELGRPGDPWLADNLALARESLAAEGSVTVRPRGVWRLAVEGRLWLRIAGVALAWAALVCLAWAFRRPLRPAGRRRAAVAVTALLAALAGLAWGAAALAAARGPRPAVLLAPCPAAPGGPAADTSAGTSTSMGGGAELSPGSEVWVLPHDGGFRVLGQEPSPVCPAPAVGLVE